MVLRDTAWSSSAAARAGSSSQRGSAIRFGRKGSADVTLIDCNRTHVWKPKLHEIAAGSMDLRAHEVDYLAQSHWHCFRYRIGEMIGLDRTRREVHVAPSLDDEGREVTPQRAFGYDTLVIAVGSQSNDFGTPGVARACDEARVAGRCAALPRAHGQRLHPRPCAGDAAAARAAQGRDHRRRRHRRRAGAELHRTTREVVAFGLDRVDANKDIKVTRHRGG